MRLAVLLFFSMLFFLPAGVSANSFFDAQTILEGETKQAILETKEDEEWFKVEVDQDRGLLLDVTELPGDLRYNVSIYDGAELEKAGNPSRVDELFRKTYLNGNQFIAHKVLKKGTYYVQIKAYGSTYSTKPFHVKFTTNSPDQNEQNDKYTQAIELKDTQSLTLNAPNDVDWFKVEVEKDYGLLLDITEAPRDLRYDVTIYDGEELEKAGNPSRVDELLRKTYLNGNQFLAHKVLKKGTYYVQIKAYGSTYSTIPFNIKFSTNVPDPNEQNDKYTQAIELKDTQSLTLNAPNDVDWFKVEVEKDHGLLLDIKDAPRDLRYDVTIYDGEELEKAGNPSRVDELLRKTYLNGNQFLAHKVLKKGTYYVRINAYGSTYSTEPFHIKLSTNTPDKNEQNDSFKQATSLAGQVLFTLNAPNDMDWFKLNVVKEKQLKFSLSNVPDDLRYNVKVYKGSELDKYGDPNRVNPIETKTYLEGNQYFTVNVPESGEYYILISAYGSTYFTTPWTIRDMNVEMVTIPVSRISLNKILANLSVGETAKIEYEILPENATNKKVTWLSSDSSVVSVSQDGKITANKAGTATITVKTADGEYQAECIVTVQADKEKHVTGVKLDKSALSLTLGETHTLKATVLPADAVNKKVQWTSDNENVAKVDQNGKVTAITPGTANITVVTEDGSLKAVSVVTVEAEEAPVEPEPNGDFKVWKPKFNVPVNKEWTVEFNLPLDIRTITDKNIYITDKNGNMISMLYIIDRQNNDVSKVTITPINNYKQGETYTLWIKDIKGTNGTIIKQNVKMEFTIEGQIDIVEIQSL